jgi:hypothetical protein
MPEVVNWHLWQAQFDGELHILARATPLHRVQLPDEVGVTNVEAQAHWAINDDGLLGIFAHLGIQRDDEHLSLRLWCAPSKPIFDLPSAMNISGN